MITEETKTLAIIIKHRALVRKYLGLIETNLKMRALLHDISKFDDDELPGFVQINRIAREYEYGSEEYKTSLKQVDAVEVHYMKNGHHPESVSGDVDLMGLYDIIEMVCDWKAASETYNQTTLKDSLEIQKKRFNLTNEQLYLIQKIVEAIE